MTDHYRGPERRSPLTDEQLETIAERAAEKALNKVYAEVGKNVVRKLFWVAGAAALALLVWMNGKGIGIK